MRYLVFLLAVAGTFLLALHWGWLPELPQQPQPPPHAAVSPPRLEPVRPGIRDVSPEGVVRAPLSPGEMVERLPAIVPPPPPPRPPKPVVYARPQAIEAGVLGVGERTIRLAGVDPTPAGRRCSGTAGDWPCGAFARTALQRFIRQRTLDCEPGAAQQGDTFVTACRIGGRDIGQWLVAQGWAAASGKDYAKDQEQARAARLGIWGDGPGALEQQTAPDAEAAADR